MRELPLRIAIMAAALLVAAVGIGATAVFLCLALYSVLLTLLSAPLAALAALGVGSISALASYYGGDRAVLAATGARCSRRTRRRGRRARWTAACVYRVYLEAASAVDGYLVRDANARVAGSRFDDD